MIISSITLAWTIKNVPCMTSCGFSYVMHHYVLILHEKWGTCAISIALIYLSQHIQSEAMTALFLTSPREDALVLYTHIFMVMCVKPKMPAKTSWWEDTFSSLHVLWLIPSAFLCLSLCHSLVLTVSLCTDMFLFCFPDLIPSTLSSSIGLHEVFVCAFAVLFWHAGIGLLSKSLYRQVLRLPSFPSFPFHWRWRGSVWGQAATLHNILRVMRAHWFQHLSDLISPVH